jgi:branched-chain amino acid transport system ATP-binding protein
MLRILNISASYGNVPVLRQITFHVRTGEIVTLVGSNGAGKSTLLNVISGLKRQEHGDIWFNEKKIDGMRPDQIVEAGLVQVPEARQLFNSMTVEENISLGAYVYRRRVEKKRLKAKEEEIYKMFPVLAKRRLQRAGTLSGGEQQMLSIARALMAEPKLLLLDEPSLGLAPLIVQEIFRVIQDLRAKGATILLVEQSALAALQISDRGYVMESGRIILSGESAELLENEEVQRAFLGKEYRAKWER